MTTHGDNLVRLHNGIPIPKFLVTPTSEASGTTIKKLAIAIEAHLRIAARVDPPKLGVQQQQKWRQLIGSMSETVRHLNSNNLMTAKGGLFPCDFKYVKNLYHRKHMEEMPAAWNNAVQTAEERLAADPTIDVDKLVPVVVGLLEKAQAAVKDFKVWHPLGDFEDINDDAWLDYEHAQNIQRHGPIQGSQPRSLFWHGHAVPEGMVDIYLGRCCAAAGVRYDIQVPMQARAAAATAEPTVPSTPNPSDATDTNSDADESASAPASENMDV